MSSISQLRTGSRAFIRSHPPQRTTLLSQIRIQKTYSTTPQRTVEKVKTVYRKVCPPERCYPIHSKIIDGLYDYALKKIPGDALVGSIIATLGSTLGYFYIQIKDEVHDFEKKINENDQFLYETISKINTNLVFPKFQIFSNFSESEINESILKMKIVLRRTEKTIKELGEFKKKTRLYKKTTSDMAQQLEYERKFIKVSLVTMQISILYYQRKYNFAKDLFEEFIESDLKRLKEDFISNKEALFTQLPAEKVCALLCSAYNIFGLIMRASASPETFNENFGKARDNLLLGLAVALHEKSDKKSQVLELQNFKKMLNKHNNIRSDNILRDLTSVLINNLGFLFNQWGKENQALDFHKMAYSHSPNASFALNGLAYAYGQSALRTYEPALQECYFSKAVELFDLAILRDPSSHILFLNRGELLLDLAEKKSNSKNSNPEEKEILELYKEALPYLKGAQKRVSGQINSSTGQLLRHALCLYAVCLSNIGVHEKNKSLQEKARVKMKEANLLNQDHPKLKLYFTSALDTNNNGPYHLPPINSNGTMRKWSKFSYPDDDIQKPSV